MIRRFASGFDRVGIVTGLEAEARIARRLGGLVAVGGGTSDGARAAALALVDQGAVALVSFGLAGGLDPALAPGALIVPEGVHIAQARMNTDPALSRLLGGPTVSGLLGAAAIAATVADKLRLWRATGCAAVDLESGVVAEAASMRGLAFGALRAVCDPAGMTLPQAAMLALSANGRIGAARVFAAVAREPGQIPALFRLGWGAVQAHRSLARRVGHIRAGKRYGDGRA